MKQLDLQEDDDLIFETVVNNKVDQHIFSFVKIVKNRVVFQANKINAKKEKIFIEDD